MHEYFRRLKTGYLLSFFILVAFIFTPHTLFAASADAGKKLVDKKCVSCHRFSGEAKSRFEIIAPDLMWGGDKYQAAWITNFLQGEEKPLYLKNYRWDQTQKPKKHLVLSKEEAQSISKYFAKNLMDPRVKKGALDLSRFTQMEATLGEQIFKEHSCSACHQINDGGKLVGGQQSTSFVNAGKRYNVDWVYRFNSHPPDFAPHSGEFVADVSPEGLRFVTGYIMTLGIDDFKFYEPWKDIFFKSARADRGKQIYKEYCSQCHGATGKGDGPAASDLTPKPAIHANMALNKEPEDYLYNVVYYGGKAVGKSSYMPYWGLTLKPQGVADVIAYMKKTFKGPSQEVKAEQAAKGSSQPGLCPQLRKTSQAPGDIHKLKNPLEPSKRNITKGKLYFTQKAKPLACKHCHGLKGDGKGSKAFNMVPPPRNFTCTETMKDITDGQMFWIIKNGSHNTEMQAYNTMKDKNIWQMILYIRQLAQ
jgi:mono/diheme cytochrome c family protein